MLDGLLSLSMEEPLLAGDLDWEEVALFEGLYQLLLILQLANVCDFAVPCAADTRRHSHCLTVSVQFDLAHSGGHNAHRLVDPVEDKGSCSDFRVDLKMVHVLPHLDSHETHATLEG